MRAWKLQLKLNICNFGVMDFIPDHQKLWENYDVQKFHTHHKSLFSLPAVMKNHGNNESMKIKIKIEHMKFWSKFLKNCVQKLW